MALLPLSGTFIGDVTTVGIVVDDEDTAEVVGQKIAHHVVGRRVAARAAPVRVRLEGRVLDPQQRIGEAGAGPMAYLEAFFDE